MNQELLRNRMVERQILWRGVQDPRVLEALQTVERHRFVAPGHEALAYEDSPLPIACGQTISQPYIVGYMTEKAAVGKESRVLEIGTGSGYQTAVLAEIASMIYTIEIIDELSDAAQDVLSALGYRNIRFRKGDGYAGWPEEAPFDAILLTAAPPHVPPALLDQLRVGGRLIVPVGRSSFQQLVRYTRTLERVVREDLIAVRFVPMTGLAQA